MSHVLCSLAFQRFGLLVFFVSKLFLICLLIIKYPITISEALDSQYAFTSFQTLSYAFLRLSKCFYNASILLLLCFNIAFIHFHMHTLLNAFIGIRFYMLSYAYAFICICFYMHTLSYAFIHFPMLS